jgi:hypothetical protein
MSTDFHSAERTKRMASRYGIRSAAVGGAGRWTDHGAKSTLRTAARLVGGRWLDPCRGAVGLACSDRCHRRLGCVEERPQRVDVVLLLPLSRRLCVVGRAGREVWLGGRPRSHSLILLLPLRAGGCTGHSDLSQMLGPACRCPESRPCPHPRLPAVFGGDDLVAYLFAMRVRAVAGLAVYPRRRGHCPWAGHQLLG